MRARMLSALALALSSAAPAAADTIAITRGSLTFNGAFFEPLTVVGERGFTFHAQVGTGAVDFGPGCGGMCDPGRPLSLGAFWTGNDLTGSATVDGRRFDDVGGLISNSSAQARFSGTLFVPRAGTAAAIVRSPFMFQGALMIFGPASETFDLVGGGTAIATFGRIQGQTSWNLNRLVFQFGNGDQLPEPTTLVLIATGVAAAFVRRRTAGV